MKPFKHLPDILLQIVNHKSQRYETAGDYYMCNCGCKNWTIKVSKMNADYEFMVMVHELVELYLTQRNGISEKLITKFDTELVEEKYKDDPGTSPKAPYFKEHRFATKIEKLICKELGIDWETYDKNFENLKY